MLLLFVGCLAYVAYWLLPVVRCQVFVAVVRCSLCVVRCLLCVGVSSPLFGVDCCCLWFVACRCGLPVGCDVSPDVCCRLFGVVRCCLRLRVVVSVMSCFLLLVGRCLVFVFCSPLVVVRRLTSSSAVCC